MAALSAAVVLAVVGGAAATIAVQARANGALRRKNDELTAALGREAKANTALAAATRRVEQRYKLAMDAIGTFHTGVSEDFLLKEPRFKELRDRLLQSATNFYGKLGSLLGQEADPASQRALAQAEYQVAELTDKLGLKEAALAAHRRVLSARAALAAEPGAGSEAAADVGRSLAAVGLLHWDAGRADEAQEAFRTAEARLAEALRATPGDVSVRAALGAAREKLGWLLTERGRAREALDVLRRARSDLEMPGGPGGVPAEVRFEQALVAASLSHTYLASGDPPQAFRENRAALVIYQALAAADPKDARLRSQLALAHYNGCRDLEDMGDRTGADRELRGPGGPAGAGRGLPSRHRLPPHGGLAPHVHRRYERAVRESGRSGPNDPCSPGGNGVAGRPQAPRHPARPPPREHRHTPREDPRENGRHGRVRDGRPQGPGAQSDDERGGPRQ